LSAGGGQEFERERRRALWALLEAIERGVVDPDALPLLSLINSLRDCYTTSSCSGRIQLAATRLPGEKTRMVVVAKWHEPVSVQELREVLAACKHGDLWISVQGPILHVACRGLGPALRLLKAAHRAGLKHSGLLWAGRRVIVEIAAADRVEAPLRLSGRTIVDEGCLGEFVERLNAVLRRTKGRLMRLQSALADQPREIQAEHLVDGLGA